MVGFPEAIHWRVVLKDILFHWFIQSRYQGDCQSQNPPIGCRCVSSFLNFVFCLLSKICNCLSVSSVSCQKDQLAEVAQPLRRFPNRFRRCFLSFLCFHLFSRPVDSGIGSVAGFLWGVEGMVWERVWSDGGIAGNLCRGMRNSLWEKIRQRMGVDGCSHHKDSPPSWQKWKTVTHLSS